MMQSFLKIVQLNDIDEYFINIHIYGTMVLLDSVSLEELDYPYDINIDDEITDFIEKNQNALDINEFLWQNIVLEVPISYTNASGTHLSGQGWELNSKNEDDGLDPRFEKLNELFKGGE